LHITKLELLPNGFYCFYEIGRTSGRDWGLGKVELTHFQNVSKCRHPSLPCYHYGYIHNDKYADQYIYIFAIGRHYDQFQ